MADDAPTLDELRISIDRMDNQIHDLLMERISITDQIAAYKDRHTPGAAKMRPGREAAILRKLLGRHEGALSPQVVARIWREIMSAVVFMQEPFEIIVAGSDNPVLYWDLARFHYGTQPHELIDAPLDAMMTCRSRKTAVAVMPAPREGEANPWWSHLYTDVEGGMKVFGCLPFMAPADSMAQAYTIGRVPLEASGDDLTWLVLETKEYVSRGRIADWLKAADLSGRALATTHQEGLGTGLYLVELDGCYMADDPALAKLPQACGRTLIRFSQIGLFARPITLEGA